eukprot:3295406-Amphidinium_carterae.2
MGCTDTQGNSSSSQPRFAAILGPHARCYSRIALLPCTSPICERKVSHMPKNSSVVLAVLLSCNFSSHAALCNMHAST